MRITAAFRGFYAMFVVLLLALAAAAQTPAGPLVKHLVVLPTKENPRNSEGSFAILKDGRVLFVYSRFRGGSDEAAADLVSRVSSDDGRTWSGPQQVVGREGAMNVMSASLLRLADGSIALFYLVKNSMTDCRLHMLSSSDEAGSWHEPRLCVPEDGYFVVNNDRVIQLKSGRLVVPAAQHHYAATKDIPASGRGEATCFLSDDAGKTWRRGAATLIAPRRSRSGFQEPAVVELKDGSLLMLTRTDLGSQFCSTSTDGGENWTPAVPTDLASPLSPGSIKRVPTTGELMVIWNDHRNVPAALANKRTPLSVALSSDEGKTWRPSKTLEADPNGYYCYTAILFRDDRVLLAYGGLAGKPLTIASFAIDWLHH
jgi:predicted neuraminidase